MRDDKRSKIMSNNSSSRRQSSYDKEMGLAFTLIFHNIKRLQDDRLCNSTPSLNQAQDQEPTNKRPSMTLKMPTLDRTRCKSDSSLPLVEEAMEQHETFPDSGVESPCFSGTEASPSQRRKVRFADDYATKSKRVYRAPYITNRSISDIH